MMGIMKFSTWQRTGDLEEKNQAMKHFNKAVELDGSAPEPCYYQAMMSYLSGYGDVDNQIQKFEIASKDLDAFNPREQIDMAYALGWLYYFKQEYTESLGQFANVLSIGVPYEKMPVLYIAMGNVKLRLGQWEDAMGDFHTEVDYFDRFAQGHDYLHLVLDHTAIDILEDYLVENPYLESGNVVYRNVQFLLATANNNLGYAMEKSGTEENMTDAIGYYWKAIEHAKQDDFDFEIPEIRVNQQYYFQRTDEEYTGPKMMDIDKLTNPQDLNSGYAQFFKSLNYGQ